MAPVSDPDVRDQSATLAVARLLDALRPITAAHEAAHAVAAATLGGRVKGATIIPNLEAGAIVDGSITWTPRAGATLRDRAVVALAGAVMSGRTARDETEVRALAEQQIEEWREEARVLVERHRGLIDTVAAALLANGTLDESQLGALIVLDNRDTLNGAEVDDEDDRGSKVSERVGCGDRAVR